MSLLQNVWGEGSKFLFFSQCRLSNIFALTSLITVQLGLATYVNSQKFIALGGGFSVSVLKPVCTLA